MGMVGPALRSEHRTKSTREKTIVKTTIRNRVAGACLAALLVPLAATAVEVAPVSGESTPLKVGEVRQTLRLRNGREVPQTGRRLDHNTLEIAREDGCTWARTVDDIYGPSLYWKNCSKGAWGGGRIHDVRKSGQLWPLKVGNKVEYHYIAENSKGKKNRKAFRKCEVTGTEMVHSGGKDYASYRVECGEHTGSRVYHYAPVARTTVSMVRKHRKKGVTKVEYLRDM